MSDRRLDALLAELRAPPGPAGLADRIAANATAVPQEARPGPARRAAGRDRRGAWLRRPLIGGAIALGLAFSGAVAATLAGVPLPAKVEAVIAQIPFVGHKAAEPMHASIRRAASRPAPRPAPSVPRSVQLADAETVPSDIQPRPAAIRRMALARQIVARREALGIPTPPARQVARMIHRRQMMQRWETATPDQREAFRAAHPRAAARIEARESRQETTPGRRQAFFESHPRALERMAQRQALRDATPEQREAFFAAHPRARAMMEARRARRQMTEPR